MKKEAHQTTRMDATKFHFFFFIISHFQEAKPLFMCELLIFTPLLQFSVTPTQKQEKKRTCKFIYKACYTQDHLTETESNRGKENLNREKPRAGPGSCGGILLQTVKEMITRNENMLATNLAEKQEEGGDVEAK